MRTNNLISVVSGILCMFGILFLLACSGQNDSPGSENNVLDENGQDSYSQPIILFDTLSHDFGTIIEGEKVVCYFDYENNGTSDLVINSVEATCGCTTPDWSREPLKPGENAKLKIIFDATGRNGAQRKTVTVTSNASNAVIRLTMTANINSSV